MVPSRTSYLIAILSAVTYRNIGVMNHKALIAVKTSSLQAKVAFVQLRSFVIEYIPYGTNRHSSRSSEACRIGCIISKSMIEIIINVLQPELRSIIR